MSTERPNPPLPVRPPPDPVDQELALLLSEPFASAWARSPDDEPAAAAVRERLRHRIEASLAAAAAMHTTRQRLVPAQALAEGVTAKTLYRAQPGAVRRPGEPLRAMLVELAPGSRLDAAALDGGAGQPASHREWLVLSGSVCLGEVRLSQRDYHVRPAGCESPVWTSPEGALLFLRESDLAPAPGDSPFTVLDAEAGWPDFAPGIQRRVLWQRDGQAALLYYAQPGAQVPNHRHGHDEECLMVQGELFLDDVLLQPGDYQVAAAGSGHRVTETDTGVVIYAHGDLDLQFVA